MRRIVLLMILLCVLAIAGNAQSLRAGVSRVDITPPTGVELWGYFDRSGPANGKLDPLFARVLVLDDGRQSVAVITLDLGRSFGPPQIAWLRDKARRQHAVAEVMLIASHTHSGPVIDDSYDDGVPEWEQQSLEKIADSIGEAVSKLKPARIGVGLGQTFIGHNRRVIQSDGSVKMLWRNSTGQQTGQNSGTLDPTVGVIRVDDAQGNPMAILVNYACHPVIFGPDNLRYSADYPGAMARLVEASFDQKPICFFLQGAPGDINPMMDKTPLAENADAIKIEIGEQLGREVVRVAKTIKPEIAATPEVAFLSEEIRFRNRWDLDSMRQMLNLAFPPAMAKRYQRYITPEIVASVTTLVINKQIALVGLPGEPFVGLQLLLKSRSPIPTTFMTGYTNGYYGYFPTISAAVAGGYGGNTLVTRVEVGAGERMVDRGLIHIYRILGKLKDKPEQP
ncbi:MAG: neutral/alkaline non-lysosomal ceramidase N-terminal domain-containing protein [Acidobacteria bacterium]|nr:neutral/alkaline non-lysosomal ceramidase N-terminal domain-containing protein [Acidobacteriota bacterium]